MIRYQPVERGRWQRQDVRPVRRGIGRLKKSVWIDMEVLGLHPEWAVFRNVWSDLIWANVTMSNPIVSWKK